METLLKKTGASPSYKMRKFRQARLRYRAQLTNSVSTKMKHDPSDAGENSKRLNEVQMKTNERPASQANAAAANCQAIPFQSALLFLNCRTLKTMTGLCLVVRREEKCYTQTVTNRLTDGQTRGQGGIDHGEQVGNTGKKLNGKLRAGNEAGRRKKKCSARASGHNQ